MVILLRDSLKRFMGKFPSFLKKDEGSNFNKVSTVFNNEFKDLFNQIAVTRLSNKLNKRLIIYKEQKVVYRYNMVFKCNLDNLKTVTIF
jgi:ribosomal protein S17E